MMDESKQTEGENEIDFSRSDFTETHGPETMRNLQRISDLPNSQNITTQLDSTTDRYGNVVKIGGTDNKEGGYQNLVEEEESQREGKKLKTNNMRRIANIINDQSTGQVYT